MGLLCTVDLFPVPSQSNPRDFVGTQKLISLPQSPLPLAGPSQVKYPTEHASHTTFTFVSNDYPSKESSTEPSPQPSNRIHGSLKRSPAPDIVHYLNDFPVTESSKMTQSLVGATFVQPSLVDYQGTKSIMFVFAVSFEPIVLHWTRFTLLLYTGPRS